MNTPTPNDRTKSASPSPAPHDVAGTRAGPGSSQNLTAPRTPMAAIAGVPPRAQDAHGTRSTAADAKNRIADALNCIVDSMDVIVREAPRGAQAQFSPATEKLTKARAAITAYCDASKQDESGPQRMENEGSRTGRSGPAAQL
jgi:hypothetical protein